MIAAVGFAAGLANMTDGNILFDGASLGKNKIGSFQKKKKAHFLYIVLMLFAISTYASSVRPGRNRKQIGLM